MMKKNQQKCFFFKEVETKTFLEKWLNAYEEGDTTKLHKLTYKFYTKSNPSLLRDWTFVSDNNLYNVNILDNSINHYKRHYSRKSDELIKIKDSIKCKFMLI